MSTGQLSFISGGQRNEPTGKPLKSASYTLPKKEKAMTGFATKDLVTPYCSSRKVLHEKQKRLFRRLVNFTCIFFVPFVVVRRLTATAAEKGSNALSILAEARADASGIVPFIFMG